VSFIATHLRPLIFPTDLDEIDSGPRLKEMSGKQPIQIIATLFVLVGCCWLQGSHAGAAAAGLRLSCQLEKARLARVTLKSARPAFTSFKNSEARTLMPWAGVIPSSLQLPQDDFVPFNPAQLQPKRSVRALAIHSGLSPPILLS
jgi:hypothetical protein